MSDERYSKRHGIIARVLDGILVHTFRSVNKSRPWHRLGKWLGLANLLALREELRRQNLHNTDGDLTQPKLGCPFHQGPGATSKRAENGTLNDLHYPAMGCRYSRFGRNMNSKVPISEDVGLLHPNPLLISEKLMKRETFQPATGLNLLAAAWIQFQVHDWFGHENEELTAADGDPVNQDKNIRVPRAGAWKPEEMIIPRTKNDPTSEPQQDFPTLLNARFPPNRSKNPMWWDGSQVYGESLEETLRLRRNGSGNLCPQGKLALDENGFLPLDPATGISSSGLTDNWWLGLELLHTLFAKEHNAICDRLHAAEPQLTDQEIFETARLVNCAIMAKIHTVEWTPGILGHPSIQPALDSNWMGLLGHLFSEQTARTVAHWLPNGLLKDMFTGVPLSETDHHGAPYALTEEFTAVYRLHPLIPDEVGMKSFATGRETQTYPMKEMAFQKARTPFTNGASMVDALYSFLVLHPGQITIGNYPDFLRNLELPVDVSGGVSQGRLQVMDLAAVDIIRDRERGVPRYNEFRRQLRMKPAESWLELSGNRPAVAAQLEEIYQDLEAVDSMVGMFCEPLPQGFGFSDTAFRIFILMATRRLKSDRFFTTDYTEEFYTRTGMEWITTTGMKEVILRHHPELARAFKPGQNAFAPWQTIVATR